MPGEGGRRGEARRRRESILQPFPPRKRAVPAAGGLAAARLPAASPPPTPEVRDKYAPAGLSRGSGVGTCPGWAGTCVRGGWRRAQSELLSPRRAAGPGYRRWGNGVRVGGRGRASAAGLQETCSATKRSWLHRRLLGVAYKRRGDREPESERATTTLWH